MSLRCFIGIHDWQSLDTSGELADFYKKMGAGNELPIFVKLVFLYGKPDSVCIRCGKKHLDDLELNKQILLRRKGKRFVLRKGKVILENDC